MTNLFIVIHVACLAGYIDRELVYPVGVILRDLELFPHIVSGNFAPDVWLSPIDPGATHFKGITADIR